MEKLLDMEWVWKYVMYELKKILDEIGIKIVESMGEEERRALEAEEIIRKRMNDG